MESCVSHELTRAVARFTQSMTNALRVQGWIPEAAWKPPKRGGSRTLKPLYFRAKLDELGEGAQRAELCRCCT